MVATGAMSYGWLFLGLLCHGSLALDIEQYKILEPVAAVYTPMKPGGFELDLDKIPAYAKLLASKGIHAVLPAGTNGESLSLSVPERMQLAEAWAKVVPTVGTKVYMHIGAESLADTMQLAAHAANTTGIAGIVSQTPLYFKPSLEGLHEYLAIVGKQAPELPFWYYHFPGKTGVLAGEANKLLSMIDEKGQIPNFAGMKFTDGALGDMQLCKLVGNGKYNILYGQDQQYLAGAVLGADAPIGSTMQYSPASRQVFALWKSGDIEGARKAQLETARLCDTFLSLPSETNPQKDIMKMLGFDLGPSRLPRRSLTPSEYKDLYDILQSKKKDNWIDDPVEAVGAEKSEVVSV
mmetsp:Transcript_31390/g.57641  ORF Transcript_31390/g.57641 Transcript_31390/m.57641 type:complete len:350 (+) Transcript_31390:60-1109(+)